MMKVYGTPLCKDCLAMKVIFGKLNVEYDFFNITEKSTNLLEFVCMRDKESAFDGCKERGGLGIPFFVKGDKKTFDINEALSWEGIGPVSEEEIARITEECALVWK